MTDIGPLVGAPSKITIADAEGNLVVKTGEIITPRVIDAARDIGRLDDLLISSVMPAAGAEEIKPAGKYVEIGVEDPPGVHPKSK